MVKLRDIRIAVIALAGWVGSCNLNPQGEDPALNSNTAADVPSVDPGTGTPVATPSPVNPVIPGAAPGESGEPTSPTGPGTGGTGAGGTTGSGGAGGGTTMGAAGSGGAGAGGIPTDSDAGVSDGGTPPNAAADAGAPPSAERRHDAGADGDMDAAPGNDWPSEAEQ